MVDTEALGRPALRQATSRPEGEALRVDPNGDVLMRIGPRDQTALEIPDSALREAHGLWVRTSPDDGVASRSPRRRGGGAPLSPPMYPLTAQRRRTGRVSGGADSWGCAQESPAKALPHLARPIPPCSGGNRKGGDACAAAQPPSVGAT